MNNLEWEPIRHISKKLCKNGEEKLYVNGNAASLEAYCAAEYSIHNAINWPPCVYTKACQLMYGDHVGKGCSNNPCKCCTEYTEAPKPPFWGNRAERKQDNETKS